MSSGTHPQVGPFGGVGSRRPSVGRQESAPPRRSEPYRTGESGGRRSCDAVRRPKNRASRKAGFVLLVEMVLAIFVLSIGVLASVALITSSLDTARESRADTRLAMFGDGILEGLRAMALDAGVTNGWGAFWDDIEARDLGIPVPAQVMWAQTDCVVRIGGPATIVLTNYAHHAGGDTSVPGLALRYVLSVDPRPTAGGKTNRLVHLRLWEGVFGGTNAAAARSFYTEISDPGVLR